jgi:hypothetical protein
MTTAITVRQLSLPEAVQLAEIAKRSGAFPALKSDAEAAVKILMGAEIGIGPMQSLATIDVIDGKPALSARLLSSLLRRAGYRWQITQHDADACVMTVLYPDGAVAGEASFSIAEAKAAGLAGRKNWNAYRKDMLFARAISRACRWYAPEVALGAYETSEMEESAISAPSPTRRYTEAEIEEGHRQYLATPSPTESVPTVASMPAARSRPEWVDSGVIPGRGEPLPELLPAPAAALPELDAEAVGCAALPELETPIAPPPESPEERERRISAMRWLHGVAKKRYGLEHEALREVMGVPSIGKMEPSALESAAGLFEAPDLPALARVWGETSAEDRATLSKIKDHLKYYLQTK